MFHQHDNRSSWPDIVTHTRLRDKQGDVLSSYTRLVENVLYIVYIILKAELSLTLIDLIYNVSEGHEFTPLSSEEKKTVLKT